MAKITDNPNQLQLNLTKDLSEVIGQIQRLDYQHELVKMALNILTVEDEHH